MEDAEAVGFEKAEQQIFQMVDAIDGWAGTLEGEVVELYEYESASEVPNDLFENFAAPGNLSSWVEYCVVGNLAMLSKGPEACDRLAQLLP